jgi:hypothetical protein
MVLMAENDLYGGWWAPLQLHAMLISQRYDLPTVNGYSGWTPEGWDLHLPTTPGYRERVLAWANRHQVLSGLCAYHVDTRTWGDFSNAAQASNRPDGQIKKP